MTDSDFLNLHPEASQLGLSLFSRLNYPDFDELVQANIEQQFAHYPDEKRADLYALLAERVGNDMTLGQMMKATSDCLHDNDRRFP